MNPSPRDPINKVHDHNGIHLDLANTTKQIFKGPYWCPSISEATIHYITWCEAKPTTLKRVSPGDNFDNHMYHLNNCRNMKCNFNSSGLTHYLGNDDSILPASCLGRALAVSSFQVMALAEYALADIPLEFLTLAKLFPFELMSLVRLWLVESIK